MRQIRQRAHLQPVGSPSMIGVKVKTTRSVESQLVVLREAKGLIRSRWIGADVWVETPNSSFGGIQLSHSENDRLMTTRFDIVDKVSVDTLIRRTEE